MLLLQLLFFVLLLQALIRPVTMAYLFTRPPRLRVSFRTPADWGVAYRDVTVTSRDGVALEGWYIPSRNGAAVILLHGHSGNRLAVAYHAETLVRAGYGAFLFDLRAHGSSGGRRFEPGTTLVDDVQAALAFLSRQPEVSGRIGILGVSVGGMVAIQAAARSPMIRAVVVDGPSAASFEDLPPAESIGDRLWRYPQERYYQAAIDWLSRGQRLPPNSQALARLSGRPILFISTGAGLERRMTHKFHASTSGPKRLWEVPRAAHASGWIAEPDAYAREIVTFFDRALLDDNRDMPDMPGDDSFVSASSPPGETGTGGDSQTDEMIVIGERTVTPPVAMMIAFATIPAVMTALLIPYQLRWGLFAPSLPEGRGSVALLIGLLGLLMAGLLLHEAVHLAGYRLIGRVGARFQFGRAVLSPQVRADGPVPAGTFRLILLLPAVILGVLPALLAFASGSWVLLIWAIWMLVAASGDYVILWAMRSVPAGTLVRSHPSRPGCQLLERAKPLQNIDI